MTTSAKKFISRIGIDVPNNTKQLPLNGIDPDSFDGVLAIFSGGAFIPEITPGAPGWSFSPDYMTVDFTDFNPDGLSDVVVTILYNVKNL